MKFHWRELIQGLRDHPVVALVCFLAGLLGSLYVFYLMGVI